MEIELGLLNMETHTRNINTVKELVLYQLHADGLVDEKQLNHYIENWQVISIKRSWFRRWAEKMFKEESKRDMWQCKYVQFEDKEDAEIETAKCQNGQVVELI